MGIEGLLVGRVLGDRYRIEEVIGRGGMGAVYRATDERLGRQVALKVVTVAGAADPGARERLRARFFREARSAAALPHHPNVVPVYDYGTDEALGLDYLVMELLRGSDLATRLATGGIPPLSLSLRILIESARGLAVGHRQGLIHRDVKPGNIFLARTDDEIQVRVVDFGIAKLTDEDTLAQLTQDGRAPHSPAYASPEQLRGLGQLTPAADVFSLGAVAFQLVTGQRPFNESDRNRMSLGMPVDPPSIRELNPALPGSVEAIILRALQFDPEHRYPDAGVMATELEEAVRHLADEPIEPYAVHTAVPLADAEDEDVTRVILAPGEEEDDRTLVAPPPEPAAEGEPMPRHSAAGTPSRKPTPPRRRRETRRGVGGILVWGIVLAVLASAAIWGWSEMSRAPRVVVQPPESDTIPEQPPEDTVQALDTWLEALEFSQQGRAAYLQQRFEDALYYYGRAVELFPDNYDIRRNYGLTLLRLGRAEDAERELRRAVELDPAGTLAYVNLAEARLAQGDTLEAIGLYRRYVEREPNVDQRRAAMRMLEELEASQDPAVDLLGEPVANGQPPSAADTVNIPAAPPP